MRAAALKAAEDILNGAKAAARDLTSDEMETVQEKFAEIERLDLQIEAQAKGSELADQLSRLGGGGRGDAPGAGEEKAARSIGDHFIKQLKGRSIKELPKFSTTEFKAPEDDHYAGRGDDGDNTYGPLLTDIDRSFVLPFRRPLVIADLMGVGTVSGNAITYPVFGALEGGTDWVAEGGPKPQMHVGDPEWRTDALGEIAGWFRITDDMSEDLPYVVSEIESTARYDLLTREEQALLQGNGTAPTPQGVLNRSGIQTEDSADFDDNADALFRALMKVQTATGFIADGVAINPIDYQNLRLRRDGNEQYYGGGYFTGQYGNGTVMAEPPIWGRRTVVTAGVPQGTAVVAAWQTAKVFRKGGLRVESTNSHEDDFTNDKITIRLRERLGLQVKYPAAFVRVNLAEADSAPVGG